MYKSPIENKELNKLYTLLNKINNAMLGSDSQTRREYIHIKKQVIDRIKSKQQQLALQQQEVVKYNND